MFRTTGSRDFPLLIHIITYFLFSKKSFVKALKFQFINHVRFCVESRAFLFDTILNRVPFNWTIFAVFYFRMFVQIASKRILVNLNKTSILVGGP